MINDIMNLMDSIQYGYKDLNGQNIIEKDIEKWQNEFNNFYFLQTPEELLKTKCGVCWDQVELERALFADKNIPVKTYFIYYVNNKQLPSHTFLTYKLNNKYYWFEHAWNMYKGIHEYGNEEDLLKDVTKAFIKEYNCHDLNNLHLYEYNKPPKHITCDEFYHYITTQKLIVL